ncbi:MAG: hypothetical protein AAFV53_29435 [Myxococcota bacterium]
MGQWFYDAERSVWELVVYDQVEVTISDAMLQALCARLELSRQRALAWIATRPQLPYVKIHAA